MCATQTALHVFCCVFCYQTRQHRSLPLAIIIILVPTRSPPVQTLPISPLHCVTGDPTPHDSTYCAVIHQTGSKFSHPIIRKTGAAKSGTAECNVAPNGANTWQKHQCDGSHCQNDQGKTPECVHSTHMRRPVHAFSNLITPLPGAYTSQHCQNVPNVIPCRRGTYCHSALHHGCRNACTCGCSAMPSSPSVEHMHVPSPVARAPGTHWHENLSRMKMFLRDSAMRGALRPVCT